MSTQLPMLKNTQPTEPKDWSGDGSVIVHSVWHTIQGEGPFAGCPAVFVRLAGCNLQCPLCDTDYTSSRTRMSVLEVIDKISELRQDGLVVVTGGEPFRQQLGPLCSALLANGYTPQIETNGTFYQEYIPEGTTVVCSPKTHSIHRDIEKIVDAWKYVGQAGFLDDDGLPLLTLGGSTPSSRPARPTNDAEVYLQPLDEQDSVKNKANLDAVVASCLRHGFRLCIQTHKIIGLE